MTCPFFGDPVAYRGAWVWVAGKFVSVGPVHLCGPYHCLSLHTLFPSATLFCLLFAFLVWMIQFDTEEKETDSDKQAA